MLKSITEMTMRTLAYAAGQEEPFTAGQYVVAIDGAPPTTSVRRDGANAYLNKLVKAGLMARDAERCFTLTPEGKDAYEKVLAGWVRRDGKWIKPKGKGDRA